MTATNMCYNFVGFRYSPPGNGRLGKPACCARFVMKKTDADSKANGKKPGSTCGQLG